MNNQLLGLAVLGIGGFVIYTMMKKRGAEEEVAIMSGGLPLLEPQQPEEVAEKYGEAIIDWNKRLTGETLPNGDKIFQPLDISAGNPLRMYYAIVKKKSVVYDVGLQTSIRHVTVGEIYLFNTVTNREVRLDELAKQATMTVDAKLATEETFANAFVEACKINPQFNPWTNKLQAGAVKSGTKVSSSNIEYLRRQCGEVYGAGL